MKSNGFFLVFLVLLVLTDVVKAQELRFNYIEGASSLNDNLNNKGNYSAIGQAGRPGAREAGAAWETSNGDIYLFGGRGYNLVVGRLNDFWRYDGEEWTWLGGSNTENAAVGEYDSAPFFPGGRSFSASCVDDQDRLWLFGGEGYARDNVPTNLTRGRLNDLWMWDGASWHWLSGADVIDQGPDTDPASATHGPGARKNAMMWYSNGSVYLFGGNGIDATLSGNKHLMDLWRWDVSSSDWTLLKGPASYSSSGDIVYSATANDPTNMNQQIGPRFGGSHWLDDNGDLWVFGGWGRGESGSTGRLNDLWRYDVSLGIWIWVHGAKTTNASPINSGPSTSHRPGARMGPAHWKDENGDFWIWGGSGYAIGNSNFSSYLADAWRWDGSVWNFEGGSDQANSSGSYGAIGPNTTHFPAGREFAFGFKGRQNEGYIFGGYRNNSGSNEWFNDLWRFEYGFHIDQGTWPSGTIPGAQDNVYVRSKLNLNSTSNHVAGNLFLDDTLYIEALVEMVYDSLSVYGDLILESDNLILGEGDLRIEGSGDHAIIGTGSVLLRGPNLVLSDGSTLQTNDKLKIASVLNDLSQTSLIHTEGSSSPGSISGNITNFFYLPFEDNNANNIGDGAYFQIGTPLQNVQLNQFSEGGILESRNTVNPAQNSVWQYNSDFAYWQSLVFLNSEVTGDAFALYAGENAFGNFLFDDASDYESFNSKLYGRIALTGIWQSPFDTVYNEMAYHSGQGFNTSGFVGDDNIQAHTEGWNMLLNPFNNFTDIKSILANASTNLPSKVIYVYDAITQTYTSFSYASSSLTSVPAGASPYLQPGQVFWVQAEETLVRKSHSPSEISFTKASALTRFPSIGVKRNTSDGIRFYLKRQGSLERQENWLGFAAWATVDYDAQGEAWYLKGPSNKPHLFMGAGLNSEHKLVINYISNNEVSESVPVFAGDQSGHQCVLEFSLNIDYLQSYADVLVEDLKTGEFSRPYGKNSYAFINDTAWQGPRLLIHLSNAFAMDLVENQSEVYLYAYRDQDNLMVRFAEGLENGSLKIYGTDGRLLHSYSNVEGDRLLIRNLPSRGIYLLELSSPQYQGSYKVFF